MTSKLSIDNRCFAGMRAAFDNALEGTVQRMIDANMKECQVGLKIDLEIAGVDMEERHVPVIKYKISTSIPMKGEMKAMLAEQILLEYGPEGVQIVQEYEQTSMI